ncbi:unnamed protein product [Lactuca virosa]|uniref:Uncharacterized protein n=1 Tax=Lactuca virosa TaxID=75947 RepID=A0AAU9LEA3_9ASTR|nr:unnamed protein product [Lactuca virosa]
MFPKFFFTHHCLLPPPHQLFGQHQHPLSTNEILIVIAHLEQDLARRSSQQFGPHPSAVTYQIMHTSFKKLKKFLKPF